MNIVPFYRTPDKMQQLSAEEMGLPVPGELDREDAAPESRVVERAPSGLVLPSDLTERLHGECAKLRGTPDSIADEIAGALRSGKRHLMLYGPPGTGKTQLAEGVARIIADQPMLITASSDWSSNDLVGGYRLAGQDRVRFQRGFLLEKYDRPTVIDEFNRCDIDKVVGPLFTLLSDRPTTLPYQLEPGVGRFIEVRFGDEKSESGDESKITLLLSSWAIFATMNTTDKASLYQMSFALMRRFAWIYIPVPDDKQAVIDAQRTEYGLPASAATSQLALLWDAVCDHRLIGAAPFIDALRFVWKLQPSFDPNVPAMPEDVDRLITALRIFIAPLLDGLSQMRCDRLCEKVREVLDVEADVVADLRTLLYELNGAHLGG